MKEVRFLLAHELRAAGSDSTPRIEGYACTWGTRTKIANFYEEISPKPFKSLATDDVVCLFNHSDDNILGRKGVNLELEQDSVGLRFNCALVTDSAVARDVYANVKAGILKECSFAFTVEPDGEVWERTEDGTPLRILRNLRCWDVSVVVNPAYPNTVAAARNVVSPAAEARCASFTGLEAQRARVQSVLNEHNAWVKNQETADAEAESRHNVDRLRLAIAKLK
jgi:HK97 family phage prohead protease